MLRGLLLRAAAVGAIALGSAASAQNFTGAYVGGNVGYVEGDVESTDLDDWNDPLDRWDYDVDGWSGGAQFGYDWALGGNWRLGVVGEAGFADIQGEGATPTSIDTFTEVEIDNYVLARGRGGVVFGGGSSFFYATAGGGWVHIDAIAHDRLLVPGPGLMEGSEDDYVTAWAYGLGFEHQISPRVSLGGEWIRLNPEELTVSGEDQPPPGAIFRFDVETEVDVLRFTVNWAL